MDGGTLLEKFRSPPAGYGPAPLLVFNDEHEGKAGEARITKVLEGHERMGYGGVFLHPRPGLMTEYLSARWFELVRHAVSECGRLGLIPYLYDENSYPSGFAEGTSSWASAARGCRCRIFRGLSLLRVAACCTVLRSRWYQSGINKGIAASRSCSVVALI